MKKTIIFVLFSTILLANQLKIKNQDVSPAQLQKQNKQIVQLAAKEINKQLPQTVDKYTTLDKLIPNGTHLEYIFKINTGAKSDDAVKKEDRSRMERAVTYGVCKSSKRFMEAQITIVYKYLSAKTNVELFEFVINQQKCYNIMQR